MTSKRHPAPSKDGPRSASPPPPTPPAASVRPVALDRIEEGRDGAPLAVLVADDGRSIVVPQAWLPADARAGATLTLTLASDPAATAAVAREAEAIRADLKRSDPGGTIRL